MWFKTEPHIVALLNSSSTPQEANGGDACNEHHRSEKMIESISVQWSSPLVHYFSNLGLQWAAYKLLSSCKNIFGLPGP